MLRLISPEPSKLDEISPIISVTQLKMTIFKKIIMSTIFNKINNSL